MNVALIVFFLGGERIEKGMFVNCHCTEEKF